ncbi:hypothetical protein BaRGS_00018084 [Batillaria attramentaria]|uniref:Uncharacterized protein n=1 Tax=Batillaria attramentaria TaxID=370345 RepID=A0ABD0KTZ4_9CAEN
MYVEDHANYTFHPLITARKKTCLAFLLRLVSLNIKDEAHNTGNKGNSIKDKDNSVSDKGNRQGLIGSCACEKLTARSFALGVSTAIY